MKKKIILSLIGLAVIIFGLIMLWPLSLTNALTNNDEVRIIVWDLGMKENGQFDTTSTDYIFQQDSEEYKQILQVLGKYSFHRSFRSFFNDTSMTGNDAGYVLQIYFIEEDKLSKSIITGGTGEITVNERVYRIGYWGNKKALVMMNEIYSVLEQAEQAIEMSFEKVAEISKAYIESTESEDYIKLITDFDAPTVEKLDFDKSYVVYCFNEKNISQENDLKGKQVWKITYNTTLDPLWGPHTIYIDRYSGQIYGTDLRV